MRATSGGQVCGACLHKSRCDLCRMFILWKVAVFCGCVQVLLLFLRGVQRRVLNLSHQDLSHSWPCDETLEGGCCQCPVLRPPWRSLRRPDIGGRGCAEQTCQNSLPQGRLASFGVPGRKGDSSTLRGTFKVRGILDIL